MLRLPSQKFASGEVRVAGRPLASRRLLLWATVPPPSPPPLLPLLLLTSIRACTGSGLSCLVTAQSQPYEPIDVCPQETGAIVGAPFHLGEHLQLTAFNHSSAGAAFCYKKGECGAEQPVYISLREGEKLPAVGSDSVTLTLCTTTHTFDGSTLCCDVRTAGKVEVKNCGKTNNGSPVNAYIYRILKWPTARACGRLCTLGINSEPDFIPPWKIADNGEDVPLADEQLSEDVLSNVIYTELIPNNLGMMVQERKIWLDFKVAIQDRSSMLISCPVRNCRAAVRLLPPIIDHNSSTSLAFTFYVLNPGTNQPVDASLVCAEAKLIPSVILRNSIVKDVLVIDYLSDLEDGDYAAIIQPPAATNLSSSAAIASGLSVFGLIATIIAVAFFRNRLRKGQSNFPKMIHDSREENGGFENHAMSELSGRIKTEPHAKETYRKVDVSDHNHVIECLS